ncbi:endoplasmic reticulum protein [Auriculariales sp. MPI-PUGE-AT-0066]|nr:endoplasmic reticulum protein [Auriculariales sp. MPI-PUGE-AT-0066]
MSTTLNYTTLNAPKWRNLPPPPGFVKASSSKKDVSAQRDTSTSYTALKERRAWDVAIGPAKQLPMQAFMLYMSGSSLQVFSIGTLVMLLFGPFTNVGKINSTFAPYLPTDADKQRQATFILQKLVFVACNLLTLALGLWKCWQVGLLPRGTGDWIAFETRGSPPEFFLS